MSAPRSNNATVWFRVVAGADGVVRIRDNVGGRAPVCSLPGVSEAGGQFAVTLTRGQSPEATLTPAGIPDPPGDLAEPFDVRRAGPAGRGHGDGRATSRPSVDAR